ncbi:gacGG [Symbiodinium natans]|uniref:GacGG protein n=1 Tax=Symbiodinium natans TaxID=878477 RepID=A0A812U403_9DINO|nr:gacGG [Symbiodinium natans]
MKQERAADPAANLSEGTDDSDDSDEDEDYDSSDETSETEEEDEESGGPNDGPEEAEEEDKKDGEADHDFAKDVLENVPAARIQSAPMIRRLQSLWGSVEDALPHGPAPQSPADRLAKLPARAPLLVTHNAVPILIDLAAKMSITIQDEVSGGFAQLGTLLAAQKTWYLLDLADVKDFRTLEGALIAMLDGTAQRQKVGRRGAQVQASVTGQGISAATALLWQGMQLGHKAETEEEPSRLIFFCSAASALIPRSILRLCFCIQNVAAFFGIAYDDPAVHEELDIRNLAVQEMEAEGTTSAEVTDASELNGLQVSPAREEESRSNQ